MSDRPSPGPGFRLGAWLTIMFIRLMRWRLDVRGLDHVPTTGGVVVTFNHHSYADFAMCGWPIYRQRGRPVRFLAKRELFDRPVLGRLLRSAGQVPVERSSRGGRSEAFEHAVTALRGGEVIAVAPEQTISRSFELLPFTHGTVRMARESGVPIVPSVNWGTQRWATKGRPVRWLAFGLPVLIRYAEPIVVGADEDLGAATDRLQATMAELLDEVQRAYPERPRPGDDWWLPARLGGSAPPHEEVLRDHRERQDRWRGGDEHRSA
ncbi:MAG TPA: lysophospholipid acyltransferase family protein [Nitriliruptorales bacterium]|nr:lysophospholipid acyltransferase family protein [Nitriliruptorales bacterium]